MKILVLYSVFSLVAFAQSIPMSIENPTDLFGHSFTANIQIVDSLEKAFKEVGYNYYWLAVKYVPLIEKHDHRPDEIAPTENGNYIGLSYVRPRQDTVGNNIYEHYSLPFEAKLFVFSGILKRAWESDTASHPWVAMFTIGIGRREGIIAMHIGDSVPHSFPVKTSQELAKALLEYLIKIPEMTVEE